jgi:anti-sigma28 factor (negative regulator of flagellin synthesis)
LEAWLSRWASNNTPRLRGQDDEALPEQVTTLQQGWGVGQEAKPARKDKVAALRLAVEQGTYQPSPMEIARAMLAARRR